MFLYILPKIIQQQCSNNTTGYSSGSIYIGALIHYLTCPAMLRKTVSTLPSMRAMLHEAIIIVHAMCNYHGK
jgi:hypothetical protein